MRAGPPPPPRRGDAAAALLLVAAAVVVQARVLQRTDEGLNTKNWLSLKGLNISGDPGDLTAIVTHTGKHRQEYVDGATMLGLSLQKHLPGYPMIALAIKGMFPKDRDVLKRAGWQLLMVEDWEQDHCGEGCDKEFMGRWRDSFEKINTFRVPFGRVLFMDADTYVFSSRLQNLLTSTHVPDGHIGLAKDGCKEEFNSGVMLFKPSVKTFQTMMSLIKTKAREAILDQNIINEVFKGKVVELSRDYNCIDLMGVPEGYKKPCEHRCTDVAVAHFTGRPKPARAQRRFLEVVRRPSAPTQECLNMNWGACTQWSKYYCDLRAHSANLSSEMQDMLKRTGGCCHSPHDPSRGDTASCLACPNSIEVSSGEGLSSATMGIFRQTNIKPAKVNGGRSIYVKEHPGQAPLYLFYIKKQLLWLIGYNYTTPSGVAYALKDATCPRDTGDWNMMVNFAWKKINLSLADAPFANVSLPKLYDMGKRKWVKKPTTHYD